MKLRLMNLDECVGGGGMRTECFICFLLRGNLPVADCFLFTSKTLYNSDRKQPLVTFVKGEGIYLDLCRLLIWFSVTKH